MKNKDNLMVYKANQVVEASYKLTLNEQRVVLACIAQVHSREALLTTDEFELSAKDFAKFFSVSEDRAYHSLIEVAESLFNRYVVIDNPYLDRPKIKRIKMRWISSIEYLTDEGKIALCFSKKMLPYLSELKGQFTRYELKHVGNMTSIYGIRLYELLMQWRTTQVRVIEVDSLKRQFEIENKYSAIKDFKKYVIDPAIKDINEHSNYDVTWNQKKTGRSVTHLIFEFKEKESAPSLVKVKKQKTKNKDDNDDKDGVIIDNIEYFADMRKKYGDAVTKAIPADMIELLKSQGRW
jgi:plasmid replication initiation protein